MATTELRVRVCLHPCHSVLLYAHDTASHQAGGHQTDELILKRRVRRQGQQVGIQWSTDWKLTDRKDANL
jgi:hypothetical protein